MNPEGWRSMILQAVERHHWGDNGELDHLVLLLSEWEQARGMIFEKGYGRAEQGLLQAIRGLPICEESD